MPEGFVETHENPTPVWLVRETEWTDWLLRQPNPVQAWAKSSDFTPKTGHPFLVPDTDGTLYGVAISVPETGPTLWSLAISLPAGVYTVVTPLSEDQATAVCLGWALGRYQFDSFKQVDTPAAYLVWPDMARRQDVSVTRDAVFMGRTLINMPANHMTPHDLEQAAYEVAQMFAARMTVVKADDLLDQNFPAIHAVGRASVTPPRLIDMRWSPPDQTPENRSHICLVGKGVCFDSGGLDLKSSSGMKLMRKDMGGAAAVLSLAYMIMALNLNVSLRVLIPAVENSVSGNSFRPGDILATRSGKTVSIGNTDAEGRLILCDALTYATESKPDLIIDMATLTGAARVGLGTQLPALFTNSDALAQTLTDTALSLDDPLWRLPLWPGYRSQLDSPVADLDNISSSPFGGAITAALFLEDFVADTPEWIHIDTYGWNESDRPGRPIGGEVLGIRALYTYLKDRYGLLSQAKFKS